MTAEVRGEGLTEGDDQPTLSGEEWPVAEHYRVEPTAISPAHETNGDGEGAESTVIVQQAGSPPERPVRRFPPDVGPGLLLALIAALVLIPGAIWLASAALDDSSSAAGVTEPTSPADASTDTTPTTETTPTSMSATKAVPDVVGLAAGDARAALTKAGFRARVIRVAADGPAGQVLEQAPAAAEEAAPKSIVVLTVSKPAQAAEKVSVPEVVGLTASEATRLLRDAGLEPRLRRTPSPQPAGTVLEQVPAADEKVDPETIVQLDVASAPPKPATVDVPDLVGLPAADARRELRGLGLRWTVVQVASEQPKGTVVGQSPRAGAAVREGRSVTLRVSTGPAQVAVPDVVGIDEQSARLQLEDAGFEVRVVDEPTADPSQDGLVVSQDPGETSSAAKGSVVTLTVARLG